jgi:hypothetical protein
LSGGIRGIRAAEVGGRLHAESLRYLSRLARNVHGLDVDSDTRLGHTGLVLLGLVGIPAERGSGTEAGDPHVVDIHRRSAAVVGLAYLQSHCSLVG